MDSYSLSLVNAEGLTMKVEQADSRQGGAYHKHLKRQKHRLERKAAKNALRRGETPLPDHKYKGWET